MKLFHSSALIFGVLVFVLINSPLALASCAFGEMVNPQDYIVSKTWGVTHVTDKHPTGCLAMLENADKKNASEILTYTPYEFICQTPTHQKISLTLLQSCCDAGRQGDYPCGIVPKGLAGKLNNMQASLTAVPGQLDARAVPELAEKLMGMVKNREMMGIGGLSDKLAEYAADPAFSKLVEKYSLSLKQAFDESDVPWARSAIARVLIASNPQGLNDENLEIDLPLSILQETIASLREQQIAVLKSLQEKPRAPEKSLPVLVDVLGNVYDDPDLIMIMQTIRAFGADSSPFLQEVYDRLEDLPREKGEEGPPSESLVSHWRDMVCSVYGSDAAGKTSPSVDCGAVVKQ